LRHHCYEEQDSTHKMRSREGSMQFQMARSESMAKINQSMADSPYFAANTLSAVERESKGMTRQASSMFGGLLSGNIGQIARKVEDVTPLLEKDNEIAALKEELAEAKRQNADLVTQHTAEIDEAVKAATEGAWEEARKYNSLYEAKDRECVEIGAMLTRCQTDLRESQEACAMFQSQLASTSSILTDTSKKLEDHEKLVTSLSRSNSEKRDRERSMSEDMGPNPTIAQYAARGRRLLDSIPEGERERRGSEGTRSSLSWEWPAGTTPEGRHPAFGACPMGEAQQESSSSSEGEDASVDLEALRMELGKARSELQRENSNGRSLGVSLAREKDRYDASRTEYYALHRSLDHLCVAVSRAIKSAFRPDHVPVAVIRPPSVSQIQPWLVAVRSAMSLLHEKAICAQTPPKPSGSRGVATIRGRPRRNTSQMYPVSGVIPQGGRDSSMPIVDRKMMARSKGSTLGPKTARGDVMRTYTVRANYGTQKVPA
ncbi:hypothetical protein KIPB_011282, partial [Kipferlia bialata]